MCFKAYITPGVEAFCGKPHFNHIHSSPNSRQTHMAQVQIHAKSRQDIFKTTKISCKIYLGKHHWKLKCMCFAVAQIQKYMLRFSPVKFSVRESRYWKLNIYYTLPSHSNANELYLFPLQSTYIGVVIYPMSDCCLSHRWPSADPQLLTLFPIKNNLYCMWMDSPNIFEPSNTDEATFMPSYI